MSTVLPAPAASREASVTPELPAGHRLVPALIGRPGRAQLVHLPCPTAWCTVNHAEIREVAVEDVTHYGPGAWFLVPTMLDDSTAAHEMYVNLTSDPAHEDPRMQAAHLVVANGSPEDAHLTEEQVEELAAELERVASEIRRALALCRASNVARIDA